MAKGLFDLSGKVTVITGGNGGMGLGFARGIAKQGGDLAIWARSAERNAAAKAELEAFGVRVETRIVDVGSEQQIIDGYKAVMDTFGRVDCVIANAAANGPPVASVFDLPTQQYLDFINVAMHGSFYTLREGARYMVKRAQAGEPGGSLIFNGSLSMFVGLPTAQPYAGSKGAMGAIIRCFAVELGKYGIRANSLAPGYIKTGMTPTIDAEGNYVMVAGGGDELNELDKMMASNTPVQRPGYPADFEAIAAYLCSDASSFHTGDTIVIDGGYLVTL